MEQRIFVFLFSLFSSSACLLAQDLTAAVNFGRYAEANSAVSNQVVFWGNSITEGWVGVHPEFFADNGFAYLDYNTLLRDENGGMIKEYTIDEVHVTKAGYALTEKAAKELIEKVLSY
ncbi:hypothetical protein EZS27_030140 [termite gut metagenome]|uniref:SGNH hydrolase-type esterase domain-containing protein n=1 Tax=termite gut metagenome TaxID=433724 RepID=A0A5J4QGT5_9ZZZZ